jgi:uncharacterized protein YacL
LDRGIKANLFLIRVVFVLVLAAAAARMQPFALSAPLAGAVGGLIGIAAIAVEMRARLLTGPQLLGAAAGLSGGGLLGLVFVWALREHLASGFLAVMIPLIAGYLGLAIGMAKSGLWQADGRTGGPHGRTGSVEQTSEKLLDTSVIIDGRIADIAESGFLEGSFLVPQFILRELQMVADSADSIRRNRGRRGLDIVQRLQKAPRISLELISDDAADVREVDLKLVEVAKRRKAKIVTNDFNLNKVAQVHGVEVLNINELANVLKPVVLPGETMRVFILKEGKEYNQGVAYLDDGTMVVVDNAKRLISKTIDITVTSVLQTTAGKMIFGKYDERGHGVPGSASVSAAAKESMAG